MSKYMKTVLGNMGIDTTNLSFEKERMIQTGMELGSMTRDDYAYIANENTTESQALSRMIACRKRM